jgi:hypothetical protein
MLVVGVTSGRERKEGLPSLLCGVVLKTTELESYAKPWLRCPGFQVSPSVCGGLLSSVFFLGSSRVRLRLFGSSVSIRVRPLFSWPTSFYRPRWGSAAYGSFVKEPLYYGKTECLTVAGPFVCMDLVV